MRVEAEAGHGRGKEGTGRTREMRDSGGSEQSRVLHYEVIDLNSCVPFSCPQLRIGGSTL